MLLPARVRVRVRARRSSAEDARTASHPAIIEEIIAKQMAP
jgi:hypothetical protein